MRSTVSMDMTAKADPVQNVTLRLVRMNTQSISNTIEDEYSKAVPQLRCDGGACMQARVACAWYSHYSYCVCHFLRAGVSTRTIRIQMSGFT